MQKAWRGMLLDIVVSGIIPTIVYHWLTTERHWTEAQALAGVIVFPTVMSIVDVVRDGAVNIISGVSLIGIVMGLGAAWMGGDTRMLLIRESLFTVLFGVAALLTVPLERPLLYHLTCAALQRVDPDRRQAFEAQHADNAALRRVMKLITAGIGALFVFEFGVKVAMVYLLPVETVLMAAPIVFNVISLGGVALVVLVGRTAMQRAVARPALVNPTPAPSPGAPAQT